MMASTSAGRAALGAVSSSSRLSSSSPSPWLRSGVGLGEPCALGAARGAASAARGRGGWRRTVRCAVDRLVLMSSKKERVWQQASLVAALRALVRVPVDNVIMQGAGKDVSPKGQGHVYTVGQHVRFGDRDALERFDASDAVRSTAREVADPVVADKVTLEFDVPDASPTLASLAGALGFIAIRAAEGRSLDVAAVRGAMDAKLRDLGVRGLVEVTGGENLCDLSREFTHAFLLRFDTRKELVEFLRSPAYAEFMSSSVAPVVDAQGDRALVELYLSIVISALRDN